MPTRSLRRSLDFAGLAKDALAVRFSSSDRAKQAAQQLVAQRLGKLRGLPQKVGQMMAFSSDKPRQEAFGKLFEAAEPLSWETMRPILSAAWGIAPETLFREIEPRGKAASLGQVHKATLQNGQKLAIKIQYPGIREAVHADLRSLGWLAQPFGNLSKGFDLEAYRATILAGLEAELDYRREAENQRTFADGPGRCPWVIVPEVDLELSCENVLVSQWVEGDTWEQVQASWPRAEKAALGTRLLNWFLESVFRFGQVHADLHPGNLRFRHTNDGPKIVLYDFGSIYHSSREERSALARLIQSTGQRGASLLTLFQKLGFQHEYLQPLESRLPELCQVLFEPFLTPGAYHLAQWNLSSRLNGLLGDDRINFRIAGPPKLIYLLRSFRSIVMYLEGLDARADWQGIFRRLAAEHVPAEASLEVAAIPAAPRTNAALYLKVQVKREGKLKAQVSLPASAIDRLETLLDDETLRRIDQEKIELANIVEKVRRRGYAPGPVFDLTDTARQVKVWLE